MSFAKVSQAVSINHVDKNLIYNLSLKFGPPKINVRQAKIIDSHGIDESAGRAINHNIPDDVTKDDLDYYGWIYPFMKFYDLVFYLYPISKIYNENEFLDCVDSYLYSLNKACSNENIRLLSDEDLMGLQEGLFWMWQAAHVETADWQACPNLNKLIIEKMKDL